MKIRILKNSKGYGGIVKSKHLEIINAVEFFLDKILKGNTKDLRVDIKFKRMPQGISGRAFNNGNGSKSYKIEVDKYSANKEILRTLAHECTHIKQFFLKELISRTERKWSNGRIRRRRVRIWKGKEIRRSNYKKRAWEVEASRNEALVSKFKPIQRAIRVAVKVVVKDPIQPVIRAIKSNIGSKVISLLKEKDYLNGNLVNVILSAIKDGQEKLQAQKEIFRLKEQAVIKVYYKEGVAWVGLN